jgi:hypothetical protein
MSSNSKIKLNLESLKSRREWKRHKVKDGHNVFRITPPFGEASNGYPYRKWQIIWGLADPESGRARPFASSLTSEKRCPVDEFVKALQKKADDIKAKLQASGSSEDEIKDRLTSINKLIGDIKPKTVYVYNAVDKAGEVGLLELKATAHKDMKEKMNQYVNDYNQDPTSLNSADDDSGLWFDVIRSGLGFKTEYKVEKCQIRTKNAAGKISFEDDRSPLPDNVVDNYDNLAYDLTTIYQTKSYEELEEVLNANMAALIATTPDADLGGSFVATKTAPVAEAPKPVGKKPVTLKLDDGDDADDMDNSKVSHSTHKTSTAKAPVSTMIEDDFMADADAILNG